MYITELVLQTAKLDEQKAFFEQALELPVIETNANSFTLQVGTTRLTFQATQQSGITYHYAFTIARNKLASSKDWLCAHGILLMKDGEQEEFFGDTWNASSIYFRDAANNIAEYIVHHELADDYDGAFGPQDMLRISEIGLVVDDVPAQVVDFQEKLGIEPYRGSSHDFTAVGDAYGLFITVKRGRPWRPTTTENAVVAPVHATIQGTREQSYRVTHFPYTIKVVPA